MIGTRPSGITLRASFDPFIVLPEAAWRQCKAAIVKTMELYGFHGAVLDDGSQTDAYERWTKWWAEEFKKDIDAQEAVKTAAVCEACHGARDVAIPCPDDYPGCLVVHRKACPSCNAGTRAPGGK